LNLESENLIVYWIGFKIQDLTNLKSITPIAIDLSEKFGFNSLIQFDLFFILLNYN